MNLLGLKGPRRMTAICPSMNSSGKREYRAESSLIHDFRSGNATVLALKNKAPLWNEGIYSSKLWIRSCKESQSFVLDFNGRVTLASVKNFQLTPDRDCTFFASLKELTFLVDYIAIQFGKTDKDTFTIDVRYPLSLFQAFGIALSRYIL